MKSAFIYLIIMCLSIFGLAKAHAEIATDPEEVQPDLLIEEEYFLEKDIQKPITLKLRYQFRGAEYERITSWLNSGNQDDLVTEISRHYLGTNSELPEISEKLKIHKDANVISATLAFKLEDRWCEGKDPSSGIYCLCVYFNALTSSRYHYIEDTIYDENFDAKQIPSYSWKPFSIKLQTIINLPKKWDTYYSSRTYQTPYFTIKREHNFSKNKKRMFINFDYQQFDQTLTGRDYKMPAAFERADAQLEEATLPLQISFNPKEVDIKQILHRPSVVIGILLLIYWLYRFSVLRSYIRKASPSDSITQLIVKDETANIQIHANQEIVWEQLIQCDNGLHYVKSKHLVRRGEDQSYTLLPFDAEALAVGTEICFKCRLLIEEIDLIHRIEICDAPKKLALRSERQPMTKAMILEGEIIYDLQPTKENQTQLSITINATYTQPHSKALSANHIVRALRRHLKTELKYLKKHSEKSATSSRKD